MEEEEDEEEDAAKSVAVATPGRTASQKKT